MQLIYLLAQKIGGYLLANSVKPAKTAGKVIYLPLLSLVAFKLVFTTHVTGLLLPAPPDSLRTEAPAKALSHDMH